MNKKKPETNFCHDNEFWADMDVWRAEHGGDNSERLDRLKRNLKRVRVRELTSRQAETLALYYDRGMTVTQIADALGTNKSTVSRTLARGRARIKKYLQYSL